MLFHRFHEYFADLHLNDCTCCAPGVAGSIRFVLTTLLPDGVKSVDGKRFFIKSISNWVASFTSVAHCSIWLAWLSESTTEITLPPPLVWLEAPPSLPVDNLDDLVSSDRPLRDDILDKLDSSESWLLLPAPWWLLSWTHVRINLPTAFSIISAQRHTFLRLQGSSAVWNN